VCKLISCFFVTSLSSVKDLSRLNSLEFDTSSFLNLFKLSSDLADTFQIPFKFLRLTKMFSIFRISAKSLITIFANRMIRTFTVHSSKSFQRLQFFLNWNAKRINIEYNAFCQRPPSIFGYYVLF
jgi:hypothetical protein